MNKKKILGLLKTIFLTGALVLFVVILICQIYESTNVNEDDDRIVLGINATGSESFSSALKGRPAPMGELIGIVSGGNFMVIDEKGDVKTTENYMLSDPIVHSKEDYCIVADFNSDEARLYEKGKMITSVETDENIISVTVNRNGFFAIATEELGYDAIITVYRKNGTAVYRYRVAKHTFVDMDISNNNRKLIVCEADMSSGTFKSRVVVAELNVEDKQSVVENVDDAYVNIHFNKNSSFVALGTKAVDIYRADTKKEVSIPFGGRTLLGADVTGDDMICLAFKGHGETGEGESVLEIYDQKGKKRGEAIFDEEISHICVNGYYVAVSHSDTVDIVNSKGKIKKTFETTSPIKYAAPFSNGNAAVVFSGGNTTIMK